MIAALIPAAGTSSRMGQPKLLLRFEGQTLIGRLVSALCEGGVRRVVVIAPPDDTPEGPAIAAEARLAGAEVVVPFERPASMRASIELGLEALARHGIPQSLVLTPGDSPGVSAEIVAELLAYAVKLPGRIIIPSHNGRRGHPIVLPWTVAAQIPSLPVDLGVNALVARHGESVVELEIARPDVIADLDTPDDLEKWVQRQGSESGAPGAGDRFRVFVRLFALAKDRAGRPELEIELTPGSTVRELRTAIGEMTPALGPLLSSALIAVDEEYASDNTPISPSSRIALIPPVSGGAGGCSHICPTDFSTTGGNNR
jgi:molybdenum cofactor cytidylyltransferase